MFGPYKKIKPPADGCKMIFKSVGNRLAGCLWNESGTRGLIVFAHGPIDEQGSNGYMTIVRKKGSKTVNEDTICQVDAFLDKILRIKNPQQ